MENRREILTAAVKAAGLAVVPASLTSSAAPYVRLDSQRGLLADEIPRFRAELEEISARFETHPAEMLMPIIYGVWANLDAFKGSRSHPRIQEYKARTAFYAGTLSITLGDETNGSRWFDMGHRYAILSGDRGLKSIGHFREAIAGTYWGRKPHRVMADARIAYSEAQTAEQKGMARMAWARAVGETQGNRRDVLASIEESLELATPHSGESPRPDQWWTHQAELMAAKAVSHFPGMMGAVENYTAGAKAGLPVNAIVLRTHLDLTLADAYAANREYEEAATRTLVALRAVPQGHRQPVLLGRGYGLLRSIRKHAGEPMAAIRLEDGLKALTRPA